MADKPPEPAVLRALSSNGDALNPVLILALNSLTETKPVNTRVLDAAVNSHIDDCAIPRDSKARVEVARVEKLRDIATGTLSEILDVLDAKVKAAAEARLALVASVKR
jgi:hypothetical protein